MADALRAEHAHVAFLGGTRAEAQLVPAAGYALRTISVEGLSRSNPLHAARALLRAALALPRARAILRELRPDAVLGGGGYVAGPVGLAALSLRIPLVLTEADSHLGLSNRLLARGARRVCLAFPIAGRDGDRYRVTGRPIPVPDADRTQARAHFRDRSSGDVRARVRRLARSAFDQPRGGGGVRGGGAKAAGVRDASDAPRPGGGGSREMGARSQAAAAGVMAGDGSPVRILHIAGRRDHLELAAGTLPDGYDLRDYLELAEFAQALAAADLVIARSGGSVFEIAAYGLPAILVPYPHASADHQSANARWMAAAGAAIVIADSECSGARLAREVAALLGDRPRLEAMAAASRSLARPRAAQDVAGELLDAAVASPRTGRT